MRDMMKKVSENLMIPAPLKSRHSLDTQVLTTSGFGKLTPIFLMEAVPNGVYDLSCEALVRFQPLASPLMHKCTTKVFYFYVPYRILWNNWQYHVMGQNDPLTGLPPVHPYYLSSNYSTTPTSSGVNQNRLADYFGIKTPNSGSTAQLNPMPFAAYQKIFNRYFRHKALETTETLDTLNDGLLSSLNFASMSILQRITYEDDYFNEALPTPQKGDPVFIDDNSPVKINDPSNPWKVNMKYGGGAGTPLDINVPRTATPVSDVAATELYAAVSIDIEELRVANAMQKFLELERHGLHYRDYMKIMFDSNVNDATIQEPVYITGHTQPVTISDVVNTADTQGKLTATGDSYFRAPSERFYSPEHGLIIGIAVTTYNSVYYRAMPKLHFKTSRFDHFYPQFDNLGEQAIKLGELNGLSSLESGTFGYVPRHHEYRKSFDMVTGEMASTYAHWHLARGYDYNTYLNLNFPKVIDERRIFVYTGTDYDCIMYQLYNNVTAELPIGNMSQPTL